MLMIHNDHPGNVRAEYFETPGRRQGSSQQESHALTGAEFGVQQSEESIAAYCCVSVFSGRTGNRYNTFNTQNCGRESQSS